MLFFYTSIYSQNEHLNNIYENAQHFYLQGKFDSSIFILKKKIKSSESSELTAKHLILLGKSYKRNYEPDQAKQVFKTGLKRSKQLGLVQQYIENALGLADIYALNHSFDSVLYSCSLIANYFDETEAYQKYYGHYLFNLGRGKITTNRQAAKEHFYEAIKHFDPHDDEIIIQHLWLADLLIYDNSDEEALDLLKKAFTLHKYYFPKDSLLKNSIYIELGFYYHYRGQINTAIKVFKDSALTALEGNSSTGSLYLKSETFRLLGWTYESFGNYKEALEYKIQNLAFKKKVFTEGHHKIGEALYWLALTYYDLAMPSTASDYIQQAIPIFIRSNSKEYQAQCIALLGHMYFKNEEYNKCMIYYDSAINVLKGLKTNSFVPVNVTYSKAVTYFAQKNYVKADILMKRAIERYKEIGEGISISLYYTAQAHIYDRLNKQDSSISAFNKGIDIFNEYNIDKHIYLTSNLNLYISFLLKQHKLDKIDTLLDKAFKSNNQLRNDIEGIVNKENHQGNDSFEYIFTCYLAGKYYHQLSNNNNLDILKKSLKYFSLVIKIIESNKKAYQYRTEDKLFREQSLYNSIYIDFFQLLLDLHKLSGDPSYLNSAFSLTNKVKSEVLQEEVNDNLAVKFGMIPDSLRLLEASLNEQLSYLKSKISKAKQGSHLYNELKTELFTSKTAYESLITHLEQNYPEYYNLKYDFKVLSIEEVQQALKPNEAIIEYFNSNDQTYAFTITQDTASFNTLPLVSLAQIEKFRVTLMGDATNINPTKTYATYTESAYQLYQQILALPLSNIDTLKINTLRIIPDGFLNLIPLETLLTNSANGRTGDYKSLPYLFKKFNISYGYSATSMFKFDLPNQEFDNSSVLAFAPSGFITQKETASLNPLKWNLQEVLNVDNYFDNYTSTGEAATETAFKEKINDYPIAHLAMHAVIDDEDPMYSKLLFAPPQDTLEDGMLHTFELYNMNLNTQMVVLSACNTGSGKLQKGEGVMSLARAFAYAGSPSVVMSHWAVDDKSTSELMKYFYQHLSQGEPKDVALRNAKLDFLENASPAYHHPYYWNNFVVMGDPAPIAEQDSWPKWQILTLLVTLFSGFIYYRYKTVKH